MTTFIEFKNVTKAYLIGEVTVQALAGVDFSLLEGEFVVILGASGAGKSTILNILGGMDTATSGQVFVGNQEITGWSEKRLTAMPSLPLCSFHSLQRRLEDPTPCLT